MADSLVQRLEQLIEQWRKESQLHVDFRPSDYHDAAIEYKQRCATQLSEVCRAWQAEQGWRDIAKERDLLRAALVKLVGSDGKEELEQMEVVMRTLPAPAEDKAATIDAIHALIATLPVPLPPGTEE